MDYLASKNESQFLPLSERVKEPKDKKDTKETQSTKNSMI